MRQVVETSFTLHMIKEAHFPALLVLPGVAVFAWLPLLALSIFTIQLFVRFSWAVTHTQWFLTAGDEHPLDAVGLVAAVVVFIVAGIWQLFFHPS
jgi:hypothetical protein